MSNQFQPHFTTEQKLIRRSKYRMCKLMGLTACAANIVRDWRWSKVKLVFKTKPMGFMKE